MDGRAADAPRIEAKGKEDASGPARAIATAPAIFAGAEFPDEAPPGTAPETLDWHVELSGPPETEVTLEFERSPGPLDLLQLEGPARWVSASGLRVEPGLSVIRGLASSQQDAALAAVPTFSYPRAPSPQGPGRIRLTIRQVASGAAVGAYSFELNPAATLPAVGSGDRVDFAGKDGVEPALLVLEGRLFAAPMSSERVLAIGPTGGQLENLCSKDDSPSEALVFSRTNALASKHLTWTAEPGEARSIPLQPTRVVPVQIWIARQFDVAFDTESVAVQAANELALANAIFSANGVGVRFEGAITDTGTDLAAECGGSMTELWEHYRAGALNIYYVRCLSGDNLGGTVQTETGKLRNTVLIFPAAKDDTLAHELGHTLRLSVNDDSEKALPDDNVMSDGICRRHLTLGQAYWANVSKLSAVNRLKAAYFDREHDEDAWPKLTLDADRPWAAPQESTRGDTTLALAAEGAEAGRALAGWLYTDDRTGVHLETLARLDGPQRKPVIPPLTALLRYGPSFAATHRYRRHLSRNHALIGDMGRDALSEEAYLRLYERRFRLRCQARAAVALARIGDDNAIAGLARGLNSLPEAVLDRLASLSKGGLP